MVRLLAWRGRARHGTVTYWVYQNWRVNGEQSRVHKGTCPHCNEGRGASGRGTLANNGRWHGPFPTFGVADAFSQHLLGPTHHCRICSPSN